MLGEFPFLCIRHWKEPIVTTSHEINCKCVELVYRNPTDGNFDCLRHCFILCTSVKDVYIKYDSLNLWSNCDCCNLWRHCSEKYSLHRSGGPLIPYILCSDLYTYPKSSLIGYAITKVKPQQEFLEVKHVVRSDKVDDDEISNINKLTFDTNPSKANPINN